MDIPLETLAAVVAGAGLVGGGLAWQLRQANARVKALTTRSPAVHPVMLADAGAPTPDRHDCVFDMKKPDGLAGEHNQWRLYRCRVPGCTSVRTMCGGNNL